MTVIRFFGRCITGLTRFISKSVSNTYEIFERYLYVFTFLVAILLAVLGFLGVAVLAAHSNSGESEAAVTVYGEFQKYIHVLFNMALGANAKPEERAIVEQFTNGFLFLLTFLAIVLSVLYLPSERKKLIKRAPYYEERFLATSLTVDSKALPIMKRIYDNAAYMKVMAGDYGWLLKDKEIAERVCQMVTELKADLFSYKAKSVVEAVWAGELSNPIYRKIFDSIAFEKPIKMKASLVVTTGGTESLIFLTEHNEENISTAQEKRRYAIFEYHSRGASSAVVDMASSIFKML